MIELMTDLPDNVVGFTAVGEVTDDDYEKVLIPAMEAKLEKYDKIRALYNFGSDYDKFDSDAMWDDAKVGFKHLTSFEKIAVVADEKWIRRSIKAFGWLMPGEVKLYSGDELDDAKAWISA
jgi:SpoIIAA-like